MASSGAQRSTKLNASPAQQAAAGAAAAEVKNQRQTSLLDIPKAVMRTHVFLSHDMNDKSLAAFARSSLYARSLAQPELDRRAVKKIFEHIPGVWPKITALQSLLFLFKNNTVDLKTIYSSHFVYN